MLALQSTTRRTLEATWDHKPLHLNKMDRIPFVVNRGLMTIEIVYLTDEDIDKLLMVVLTSEHYKPSDAHGPEEEAII